MSRNALPAAVTVATVLVGGCGSDGTDTGSGAITAANPTAGASGTASPATESGPEPGYDRTEFSAPTKIDNKWLPLTAGTQLVFEGFTVEDGEQIPHRLISTVTDLTKEIDGVPNVVVWDRDYESGELVEAELAFFAQADDGDVWHFGEYPEEYEDGEFVAAPTWIHGLESAEAGIAMPADPKLGDPSHAQGWGPEVDWTDRARVHQVGERVCVPVGCYGDALAMDETSQEEPDAHQYKYYAADVGLVQVGFGGADPNQETLQLAKIVRLGPAELAEVRADALELEKHAYAVSADVYGQTPPLQPPSSS